MVVAPIYICNMQITEATNRYMHAHGVIVYTLPLSTFTSELSGQLDAELREAQQTYLTLKEDHQRLKQRLAFFEKVEINLNIQSCVFYSYIHVAVIGIALHTCTCVCTVMPIA